MKKIILVALATMQCPVAFAACQAPVVPPAVERALALCAPGGRYSIGDRGGAEVEKAAATCAKLRQHKENLERNARSCEAQTVPDADRKILDDAVKAIGR